MANVDPPKGWSKQGAEHYGIRRPDYAPDEPCYYCGVLGCEECGAPPKLLAQGFAADDDPPEDG